MRRTALCVLAIFSLVTAAYSQNKNLKPATIRFAIPSEGTLNDSHYERAAKAFEALNPQVKVELVKMPTNGRDVGLWLNAAALAGDYPDIVSLFLAHVAVRGTQGELLNLAPYVNKWTDKSDIMPSALKAGVFRGEQLAIGYSPSPNMFVYRKDYFSEAGLDPSKPPKNWDELKKFAAKLVKKDASGKVVRAGLDVGVNNTLVQSMIYMRQAGSRIADLDKEMPSITDSGAVRAFEYLVGMKDQSIPFDAGRMDDYPFMKGNAAMSNINMAQLFRLAKGDSPVKDKVGIMPVFDETVKVGFNGNRCFAISKNSKSKDQAWAFIEFMLGKDQVWKRADELNIPVVRMSLMNKYVGKNPAVNEAIFEYVLNGEGNPPVPWVSIFSTKLDTAFQEVYNGRKSAKQALIDADEATRKEIKALF